MLYEFVTTYRDAIIAKTRVKVSTRPWPPASTTELEHGLPMFLTQLAETLRWEHTATRCTSMLLKRCHGSCRKGSSIC
jgi:hypothetical protein